MAEPIPGVRKRRSHIVALGAAILLAGGAAALLWPRTPKLEGETAKDLIASICAIADEGAPGAGDVIAKAATEQADPTVRRAAIAALYKFPQPRYRQTVEAGTKDKDAGVREAAAVVLARYQDDASVRRLAEVLRDDADPRVRNAAADSLKSQGTPLSVVLLVEAAESDKDPNVQLAAAAAVSDGRFVGYRPEKVEDWRDMVEAIKDRAAVQDAFRKAGRTLVRHPEHRIVQREH
jgi:HEAT repeat protein